MWKRRVIAEGDADTKQQIRSLRTEDARNTITTTEAQIQRPMPARRRAAKFWEN